VPGVGFFGGTSLVAAGAELVVAAGVLVVPVVSAAPEDGLLCDELGDAPAEADGWLPGAEPAAALVLGLGPAPGLAVCATDAAPEEADDCGGATSVCKVATDFVCSSGAVVLLLAELVDAD